MGCFICLRSYVYELVYTAKRMQLAVLTHTLFKQCAPSAVDSDTDVVTRVFTAPHSHPSPYGCHRRELLGFLDSMSRRPCLAVPVTLERGGDVVGGTFVLCCTPLLCEPAVGEIKRARLRLNLMYSKSCRLFFKKVLQKHSPWCLQPLRIFG